MSNLKKRILPFYLMTIIFSWILLFVTDAWLIPKYKNTSYYLLIALYGHLAAMMGPILASVISLKYFQKRKLLPMRWKFNKYYLYTIYAIIVIWILPALVYLFIKESFSFKSIFNFYEIVFIISYLLFGWFAGIGEEYGWSGYLLTELSPIVGEGRAVVFSGILRGIWHLPLLVIPVFLGVISGNKTFFELIILTIIYSIQLIISNIFMSTLFGYTWFKTGSIPLVGWMHFLFDFGRDISIFLFIGFADSIWFKFGWGIPFYFLAYLAFMKLSKEEGYSNYLEVFYKKNSGKS